MTPLRVDRSVIGPDDIWGIVFLDRWNDGLFVDPFASVGHQDVEVFEVDGVRIRFHGHAGPLGRPGEEFLHNGFADGCEADEGHESVGSISEIESHGFRIEKVEHGDSPWLGVGDSVSWGVINPIPCNPSATGFAFCSDSGSCCPEWSCGPWGGCEVDLMG